MMYLSCKAYYGKSITSQIFEREYINKLCLSKEAFKIFFSLKLVIST